MSVLDGPASRITRAPRRSTSPSQELSCRLVRARARVAEPSEASSRPSTTAVVDVLVSTWGFLHETIMGRLDLVRQLGRRRWRKMATFEPCLRLCCGSLAGLVDCLSLSSAPSV